MVLEMQEGAIWKVRRIVIGRTMGGRTTIKAPQPRESYTPDSRISARSAVNSDTSPEHAPSPEPQSRKGVLPQATPCPGAKRLHGPRPHHTMAKLWPCKKGREESKNLEQPPNHGRRSNLHGGSSPGRPDLRKPASRPHKQIDEGGCNKR